MSALFDPRYGELLSAMIGLARATDGRQTRPETVTILLNGVRGTLGCEDALLAALIRGCRREKLLLAPGCASCAAPCGRTADYDLTLLRQQDEAVRTAKQEILQALQDYAMSYPAAPDAPAVFTAVFALGECWAPEELRQCARNLRKRKGDYQ